MTLLNLKMDQSCSLPPPYFFFSLGSSRVAFHDSKKPKKKTKKPCLSYTWSQLINWLLSLSANSLLIGYLSKQMVWTPDRWSLCATSLTSYKAKSRVFIIAIVYIWQMEGESLQSWHKMLKSSVIFTNNVGPWSKHSILSVHL